jgi:hypothetical protein
MTRETFRVIYTTGDVGLQDLRDEATLHLKFCRPRRSALDLLVDSLPVQRPFVIEAPCSCLAISYNISGNAMESGQAQSQSKPKSMFEASSQGKEGN